MFYFFEKEQQFLQCEVRAADHPDTFAIIVTEPGGQVRARYVTGSQEVMREWLALQEDLAAAGWWGPHGRD